MGDARSTWRPAVPALVCAGVAAAGAVAVLAAGAGPYVAAVVVLAGLVLTAFLAVQLRLVAAERSATVAASRAEVAGAERRLAERTAEAEELGREIGTVRSVLDSAARSAPTAFVEEVEVTCVVGATAAGDTVTETRQTTAIGYVPYRTVRLIAAPGGRDGGRDPRPDVEADDADLAVAVLPLGNGVASRVAVVFLPGLSGRSLRWHTRYAVPGLWDELRATGEQTFRYPLHRGVPDGTATPVSRLTMSLLFPAGMTKIDVTERNGRGWGRAETTVLDQTRITWIEEAPDPTTYEWDVAADPGTR